AAPTRGDHAGMAWRTRGRGMALYSVGGAELPPIAAPLAGDGGGGRLQGAARLAADRLELASPEFAFDRDTLRDRRALRQHAAEREVAPARREVDEVVLVEIAVDQPGQSRERQVMPIDRMGDQERIARRRFNRPKTIELDDEAVFLEERRALDLDVVVEIERRA